jgi:NhaP-type Na+/H+ or K+/H+ antiporter
VHFIIVALFVLLLVCVFGWLYIYRSIGQGNPINHPRYRLYQSLLGLIATLVILLALLIVFSSDPGNPDDYLWRP